MTDEEKQERLSRISAKFASAFSQVGTSAEQASEALQKFGQANRVFAMAKIADAVEEKAKLIKVFPPSEVQETRGPDGTIVAMNYTGGCPYQFEDMDMVQQPEGFKLDFRFLVRNRMGTNNLDELLLKIVEKEAGEGAQVEIVSRGSNGYGSQLHGQGFEYTVKDYNISIAVYGRLPAAVQIETLKKHNWVKPTVKIGEPIRQQNPGQEVREEWEAVSCKECRGAGCKACAEAGKVLVPVQLPTRATVRKKRPKRQIKL